jgi:hypothetical protein
MMVMPENRQALTEGELVLTVSFCQNGLTCGYPMVERVWASHGHTSFDMERISVRFGKTLGMALLIGSWGVGLLAAVYFFFVQSSIPLALLAWPAVGILVGLLIILSDTLEKLFGLEDEIWDFPEAVTSFRRALLQGRINQAHLYLLLTIASIVAQTHFILRFQKWNARWGFINVFFFALLVVIVAWAVIFSTPWFQVRKKRLTGWVFLIPAFGWLLCVALGVHYKEPDLSGLSRFERQEVLASGQTMSSNTNGGEFRILNFVSDGASFDFDCDDEGCLILILLFVTVICVSASATIPHFWLVATLLLLTIMAGIALRELLYVEKQAARSG